MPKLISDRPGLIRQVRAEPQVFRSETAYRSKSTKQTSSPEDVGWCLRGSWVVEVGGIRVVGRPGPSVPLQVLNPIVQGRLV